jgi:hypothetical protein
MPPSKGGLSMFGSRKFWRLMTPTGRFGLSKADRRNFSKERLEKL